MDSLASLNLYIDGVVQIAKLYSSMDMSEMKLKVLSVQQKNGFVDCGLFSIAFAMEVCLGRKPQDAQFCEGKMRPHLVSCLSAGGMEPFSRLPSSQESVPRPRGGILSVKLFCVCGLPAQFDTDMIACDIRDKWYHCSCVHVNPVKVPGYWECPVCS